MRFGTASRLSPGVTAVSYSSNGIFIGTEWHTDVHVSGHVPRTPKDSVTAADQVGAGYAAALGARLVAGRDLDARDEGVAPRTALVNASFARFFFPGANAVGGLARFDDSSVVQIVGVIADVRGQSLDTTGANADRRIYVPYLHQSGTTKFSQPKQLRLLVRTTGDPSALVQPVRRAIVETDRSIAIDDLEPVTQLIRLSIRDEHLVARLATGLGALALLLAAIGLFGVTSYSIARRTSEIGVRIALGARRADIARLVMRDGLRPVAAGVGDRRTAGDGRGANLGAPPQRHLERSGVAGAGGGRVVRERGRRGVPSGAARDGNRSDRGVARGVSRRAR